MRSRGFIATAEKRIKFNAEIVDLGSLKLNSECAKTINQRILNGGSSMRLFLLLTHLVLLAFI
jgi:hypothetical protein